MVFTGSGAGAGSAVAAAAVLGGLVAAGVVDYLTGVEIRVYPLYFVAVSVAAWRFRRVGAALAVVLATVVWVAANLAAGLTYSQPYILPLNALAQFVTFALVAGLLSQARDSLERERARSSTDRTTGLLNARGFRAALHPLVAACRRSGRPLTLVYIDLDNFKCVNDRFGHAHGDELLAQVGQALKASLRVSDLAARLGGDEFAVCLPETSAAQAEALLERLRTRLAEVVPVDACAVSASLGAVHWPCPPASLEAMISAADQAMYRAKRAGKNRVVVESVQPQADVA